MRVYKYDLELVGGVHMVYLPKGAMVLDIQLQYNPATSGMEWKLWAGVEPDAPDEERSFFLAPTGVELPPRELEHISTVQEGEYVFHWFEIVD